MRSLLFLCLSRPKKDQKNHNVARVWGDLAFISPPYFQPCGWMGPPNVSPLILTHARRKDKLNGQKHTIAFPQEKLFVISCLSAYARFILPLEAEIKEMNHNKELFLAILELFEV